MRQGTSSWEELERTDATVLEARQSAAEERLQTRIEQRRALSAVGGDVAKCSEPSCGFLARLVWNVTPVEEVLEAIERLEEASLPAKQKAWHLGHRRCRSLLDRDASDTVDLDGFSSCVAH